MVLTEAFGEVQRGVFPAVVQDTYADDTTQPFWDAAAQGRLTAIRCTSCGTFRLPPAPVCFECQAADTEWVDLPGTATVYTFTIVRHPLHPDLAEVCPYVVGVVELDGTQGAGARMIVNIIDCDPDQLQVGDRVRVAFEQTAGELRTPRFRPIGEEDMHDR